MAEETLLNPPNTVSDDSCITEFIEIVPLARECNEYDYCDEIKQEILDDDEIKPELLQDIKQEPADELYEVSDVKDIFDAAEVRLWFLCPSCGGALSIAISLSVCMSL